MAWVKKEVHYAFAVMDKDMGRLLNYHQLLQHPDCQEAWTKSSANKFGCLANGLGGHVKGTNTIKFIHKKNIPWDRMKDITYGQFV
jgi:hypothetical protein